MVAACHIFQFMALFLEVVSLDLMFAVSAWNYMAVILISALYSNVMSVCLCKVHILVVVNSLY